MTPSSCAPREELLAYWLGELDEAHESRVDEHLFACSACSDRLRAVVELGAAIRGAVLGGELAFMVPTTFVRRIKEAGLRVREYTLTPGGSVDCTVTPDDDLVVANLEAPLHDVRRLDVVITDRRAGTLRVSDVAFDAGAGGLTMVPSVAYLRTLRYDQQRVQLLAVEGAEERVIADYTFNHFPS